MAKDGSPSVADIERLFRQEHARAIAALVRRFGDITLAEDAVQGAFGEAVARWPAAGPPASPAGWIITTARNRALDRIRREARREERYAQAGLLDLPGVEEPTMPDPDAMRDEQLSLIFTCCHPAIGAQAQVALTLRLLGGLSTAEIAHAFLTPEAAMAQRLVRAKAKIRDARIPFRTPDAGERPARLAAVLGTIYLIFNEGYVASQGDGLFRADLCKDAIRLARLLFELMPDEPEVMGLLGLMLLTDSRRGTRLDTEGNLATLARQDRARWDRALIAEGLSLVRRNLQLNRPGPYQIQAAINAVHSDAATAEDTDWKQITALYDHLMAIAPNPIVALNRAVALAEVEGPQPALDSVDALALDRFHLFHAIRADFLRRLGRLPEARAAYSTAIDLCGNAVERAFLSSRRDQCETRQ